MDKIAYLRMFGPSLMAHGIGPRWSVQRFVIYGLAPKSLS